MGQGILLTSFATWKPDQLTNASDDLLLALQRSNVLPERLHYYRQMPVDFQRAFELAIALIDQYQPQRIVLCGMAASRSRLSVESQAIAGAKIHKAIVNVDDLVAGLPMTEVSHDAGRFVCNGLYYAVLSYLKHHKQKTPCIFVHVPVLTHDNREAIVADTYEILQRFG
jgi:pyroglutamyl-peptidase